MIGAVGATNDRGSQRGANRVRDLRSVTVPPKVGRFLEPDAPAWTTFKIASCQREMLQAFRVIYDGYVRAGLAKESSFRMRVSPYQLLPTTDILVAVRNQRVYYTMSLVRDGELGLPLESVFKGEVAERRKRGLRLAEVSCLAGQKEGRRSHLEDAVGLMRMLAQCARHRGVDELLIAVHPRHARFYERYLAFTPMSAERPYADVCGQPAVAMSASLKIAAVGRSMFHHFFGVPFRPEMFVPYRMSVVLRMALERVVDANFNGRPWLEVCAA